MESFFSADSYDEDLMMDQVYNAMKISDASSLSFGSALCISRDPAIINRTYAVEWIKKVLVNRNYEVRDLCVRIFDTYISLVYSDNPTILRDKNRIAFIAASSMILSSKILNANEIISASVFCAFDTNDLHNFEKTVIVTAGSRISPMSSPAYYLEHFTHYLDQDIDKARLIRIASNIIGEFWEDSRSLLFASSTIAMSAVVVALSLLKVHSPGFLTKVPDFFFPSHTSPFFQGSKQSYLDCATCLQVMERMPSMRIEHPTRSPVCVSDETLFNNTNVTFECVKLC